MSIYYSITDTIYNTTDAKLPIKATVSQFWFWLTQAPPSTTDDNALNHPSLLFFIPIVK